MKKLIFLFLLFPLYAGANATNCDQWKPLEICDVNGNLQQSYLADLMLPPDYAWPFDMVASDAVVADKVIKTRTHFIRDIHTNVFAVDCAQTCDLFVPPPGPSLYNCDPWGPGLICDEQGSLHPIQIQVREADGWWLDKTDQYQVESPTGMMNIKDFTFKHPDAWIEVLSCNQSCTLVDNCGPGETQGPLGICTVTDGPYLCGNWAGSAACHPETGALVEDFIAVFLGDGYQLTSTSDRVQKNIDWGMVNKWRTFEFTNETNVVNTQICNQACFAIDYCPVGEVPDQIGLCVPEQFTTITEPVENTVLLSESGTYFRDMEAAAAAVLQIQSQGDPVIEYGTIIYMDRNQGYKYVYSNLVEKTPGSIGFTADVVQMIEAIKSAGHRIRAYLHTQPSVATAAGPTEEDLNYATFLQDGFRIRSFYVAEVDGTLTRYRANGYVYPSR